MNDAERADDCETCCVCQQAVTFIWTAPDEIWRQVRGDDQRPVCPRCFDAEAEAWHGLLLRWVPIRQSDPISGLTALAKCKRHEAEKQRADKAEAACAEMRVALEDVNGMLDLVAKGIYPGEMTVRKLLEKVNAAAELDAGKGWVSPEEHDAVCMEASRQQMLAEAAIAERDQARAEAATAVDTAESALRHLDCFVVDDNGSLATSEREWIDTQRRKLRDGTAAKAMLDEIHAQRALMADFAEYEKRTKEELEKLQQTIAAMDALALRLKFGDLARRLSDPDATQETVDAVAGENADHIASMQGDFGELARLRAENEKLRAAARTAGGLVSLLEMWSPTDLEVITEGLDSYVTATRAALDAADRKEIL